ncbi:MAG: site-specific DNA-methyltransferase [Desulfobacteraceae bacterium]|nr:MAG: site-specific DNA-methyltransferase [Desulfobacteraceae bacterium]
MAKKKATEKEVEQYTHNDKDRMNNPPVGLVTPDTDKDAGKKKYQYDPHLEPQLQWAGKAEHTSFEVDTVSLHVHERIDPKTILDSVRKEDKRHQQLSLFEAAKRPLREEIEFYKHRDGWTNRLVAGDSLLVMNSLLEKEGMGGKVQMVYFDPPYGIKYGSNFQPFVNKRDVKDGNDQDLTSEPEMIKAFRDTWELGIHSYLTYIRDRLLLARELLHESGSIFVQISDENVHLVRNLMDEVFGVENFVSLIYFATTSGFATSALSRVGDFIIWYGKEVGALKYRQLFIEKENLKSGDEFYKNVELHDGSRRPMVKDERDGKEPIPDDAKIYGLDNLQSQGAASEETPFQFEGKIYKPKSNSHWKARYPQGMERLKAAKRIEISGATLRFVRFLNDYPVKPMTNSWMDTSFAGFATDKKYVVETNPKVIQRCLLMTTDPGDLVFDITCGSGTTAYVAEQWGRRWITCDTSRVATTLAKQRLMTASFDYYELAHPSEGVGSGFRYKTVPHITLKSIANNEPPAEETLYDQPLIDRKKTRITGPFTMEAVPAPVVKSIEEIENEPPVSDTSVARSGETLRQTEWRDELFKSGIRAKGGRKIEFSRIEPLSGTRYLQAEGETREEDPKRVFILFGPEHAPLEQRQVELGIEEANLIKPKPDIILFVAFQFDAEAAKDIDEMNWPGVTLLRIQMNADMFTEDLKKNKTSNESFWLMGQPDVRIRKINKGEDKDKIQVEVAGFDYYNPITGNVESGSKSDIAMWMLDTDYDGRSLMPRQVFFPMAGDKEGWDRLARNLKAEIDEEKIEAFRGTVSLPFKPGRQIAIKIIDARGVESLKIEKM